MLSVWKSLASLLAVTASAYADCSAVGTGASDSFSGNFRLAAYDAAAETTTTLTLANSLTVPMTSFFVLSVRIPDVFSTIPYINKLYRRLAVRIMALFNSLYSEEASALSLPAPISPPYTLLEL